MKPEFTPHPLWKENAELAQNLRDKVQECHERGHGHYNFGGIEMGDEGLSFLAHEMNELRDVSVLRLSTIGATDEGMKHVVTLAKNSPEIRQISIENNTVTHQGIATLAAGLEGLPQLTHFDARNNPLGQEAGEALARIAAMPSLRSFCAMDCQLGDEGVRPITAVIAKSHTLEKMQLGGNDVSLEGCKEYMQAIRKNRSLTHCSFQQGEEKDDLRKEYLTKAYAEVRNPNLTFMLPLDHHNRAKMQQNKSDVKGLPPHLAGELKNIDHGTLKFIDARANGIFELSGEFLIPDSTETRGETYTRYESFMRSLPRLPEASGEAFVKALFTEDANGFTPLDNPRVNRTGEALLDGLKASDTPLSHALLTRETRRGGSVLEAMAGAMETEKLVSTLNQAGIQLGAEELLNSNGLPTQTLHNILDQDGGAALFTADNWQGKHRGEMKRVYDALPASQKEGVALHSLQSQMRPRTEQGIGR
ncbi:MAG: hypothetical protein FJX23_01215 [Alphaproteobacteria bacterium]|nr:hypothetical protein [Alphaproteobacteria bacterium]